VESDFPGRSINRSDWFPSNYDQPHNFNLTAVRSLGQKSAFSFNFIWRSGRPITAIYRKPEKFYSHYKLQNPVETQVLVRFADRFRI